MLNEVAPGYCYCGCGRRTNLIKKTDNPRKRIKGEYSKYLRGHGRKGRSYKIRIAVRQNGYYKLYLPSHSRANTQGYVFEHILLAEKALGKPLPLGSEVHHLNGNGEDNVNNLVICQDRQYHALLHMRSKAKKLFGNVNYRKCVYCKKGSHINSLIYSQSRKCYFHHECYKKYWRVYNAKRRERQVANISF